MGFTQKQVNYVIHAFKNDDFLSEEGMKIFLLDKRISHLLYEHKVCMAERIRFMEYKKALSTDIAQIETVDFLKRNRYNTCNTLMRRVKCGT